MEIVGVVNDATYRRLRDELPPTFYVPISQWMDGPMANFRRACVSACARRRAHSAKARGAAAQLARGVAEAIGRVDPAIGITFTPLARQIDDTWCGNALAMLSAFFGGLALLLSGLGLYGLMAYSVSRRRHEIGIRMALGAEARAVVRMVLPRPAAHRHRHHRGRGGDDVGVAIRGGAALWRDARGSATLAAAAFVLVTVGVAAGWIPARRASRIDPARVLHGE